MKWATVGLTTGVPKMRCSSQWLQCWLHAHIHMLSECCWWDKLPSLMEEFAQERRHSRSGMAVTSRPCWWVRQCSWMQAKQLLHVGRLTPFWWTIAGVKHVLGWWALCTHACPLSEVLLFAPALQSVMSCVLPAWRPPICNGSDWLDVCGCSRTVCFLWGHFGCENLMAGSAERWWLWLVLWTLFCLHTYWPMQIWLGLSSFPDGCVLCFFSGSLYRYSFILLWIKEV